jgi:hypothetical protein
MSMHIVMDFEFGRLTHPLPQVVLTVSKWNASYAEKTQEVNYASHNFVGAGIR